MMTVLRHMMLTSAMLTASLAAGARAAEPAEMPMQGTPPLPETQVTLMNASEPPFSTWAFRNMGINPSLMVARGGRIFDIPRAPRDGLEDMRFTYKGETHTVLSAIEGDSTDGIVVIKDGAIVYERYFQGFTAYDHHLWASCTKSLVSLAAGILVDQGKLDLSRPVDEYIPELEGSAFDGLTVQTVLNMVSAIDYSEDYQDLKPGSVHYEYFRRIGMTPAFDLVQANPMTAQTPRGVLGFLPQFRRKADLEPKTVFEYQSPNVDVIGWIVARQSGMPLHSFIREHIWSKLGAEHDAFFMTDVEFSPVATGGFNSSLRDFARLGLAVVGDGTVGGIRIFAKDWVEDIPRVSDMQIAQAARSVYKSDPAAKSHDDKLLAYKNFWWVLDRDRGIFTARGVFGQTLFVDRSRNVVIAAFASAPSASNAQRETYKIKLHAMTVLAEML